MTGVEVIASVLGAVGSAASAVGALKKPKQPSIPAPPAVEAPIEAPKASSPEVKVDAGAEIAKQAKQRGRASLILNNQTDAEIPGTVQRKRLLGE